MSKVFLSNCPAAEALEENENSRFSWLYNCISHEYRDGTISNLEFKFGFDYK